MNVATVTLNPAIDQTVAVDNFRTNTVNRGRAMQFDAGGKGVNVASFLADHGLTVGVTGFLGRENAEIFEQFFADKRIDDQFIRIPGRTRIGVKIVDEVNQQTTDINMPGQSPTAEALNELLTGIERMAATYDWFVLAGNLPPEVPPTIYATIIKRLAARGTPVALDTSADALRHGVQAGPTLLKPNIDELQQLVGHTISDEAGIAQAARELLGQGIRLVVVSMGERGALFVDAHTALVAVPPAVQVKSTVGAGDAMVAGLVTGQVRGLDLATCARLATAFSVGTITRVGAHLPPDEEIQAYAARVSVRPLENAAR